MFTLFPFLMNFFFVIEIWLFLFSNWLSNNTSFFFLFYYLIKYNILSINRTWVDQTWTDMSHYQKMVFCQIKLQLNLSCMQFCRIQTFYICLSAVDKMKFMSHFFYFYCRKLGSNQYLNLTRNSFLPVKLFRLLIASGENRTPMFTSSM